MKASTTLLTGLIILAAGIVLIICNRTITQSGIVITAGILFLLSGIVNTVLYLSGNDKNGEPKHKGASKFFGIVVSMASLMLGLSMFIFNDTFQSMIPMLFGLILLFGTIVQVYIIFTITRAVGIPGWTYIFPGIIMVLSLIVFMAKLTEPQLMIISGSGLVVFGIGGFVESMLLGSGNRRLRHEAQASTAVNPVDVKAKEVKEIKGLEDK